MLSGGGACSLGVGERRPLDFWDMEGRQCECTNIANYNLAMIQPFSKIGVDENII
jgi:hypothetical protein